MKDLILEILKIVAPWSVALIMFAQGLGIAPIKVLSYFRERRVLLLRSLFATLVLVPAAALALILLLKPAHGLAVALGILVACPPAPLMLKSATGTGGGSAEFMATLHLLLAVLAFVTIPAILQLLSQPLDFRAAVDMDAVAWILSRTILLPVGLGMAVHVLFTPFADKASLILGRVGTVALVVVVLFAGVGLYPALLSMDVRSYLVIATVAVVALGIGHFLGPSDPRERTDLAVECGVRHPMLALTIAGSALGPENAARVLVPCIITSIAIATVYLMWRGRKQGSVRRVNRDPR